MDAAVDILCIEHCNGALNGPPVAEVHDVAETPALVGAIGRFQLRIFAEFGDQVRSLGENGTVGDMNIFLQATYPMLCAYLGE